LQVCKSSLYLLQNPPASLQKQFVLTTKPSCKFARAVCTYYKTFLQVRKSSLYLLQNLPASSQEQFVPTTKPSCKSARAVCIYYKTL
ncbi:MAG: hypothetical protein ACRC9X_07890, partial [Bacteroidales bacterium]